MFSKFFNGVTPAGGLSESSDAARPVRKPLNVMGRVRKIAAHPTTREAVHFSAIGAVVGAAVTLGCKTVEALFD